MDFRSGSYVLQLDKEENDICTHKLECGECIKHPECAWCADPKWDNQEYDKQSNINDARQSNPTFTYSDNSYTKRKRRRPRCNSKYRLVNICQ